MPTTLSSLLNRTRHGILVLLLVVLPLQSMAQLVVGLQAHRHVHTGSHESALSGLTQPLRALLDHLHAAQDPRLQAPKLAWAVSQGDAGGLHEHNGVFHRHSHDTADVLDVGDPADESLQAGGATAFLAWLPAALALPAGEGGGHPAIAALGWRDRVVAPPLTPPRG